MFVYFCGSACVALGRIEVSASVAFDTNSVTSIIISAKVNVVNIGGGYVINRSARLCVRLCVYMHFATPYLYNSVKMDHP